MIFTYLLINHFTINGSYNNNKDGIKYGSHVFWYTFFTGLGETNQIIESPDDGVGLKLVKDKRPDLKTMSSEWGDFFKVTSLELIMNNKLTYLNLIYYRINKVFENQSNWRVFNINEFKIYNLERLYGLLYLISILYFIIIFLNNRDSFLKSILIMMPVLLNSDMHILVFTKNYYYYILQPFNYFIFFSLLINNLVFKLKQKFN